MSRESSGRWIPYAVVVATLTLAALVSWYVWVSAEEKDRFRFDREVVRLDVSIESTIGNYVTLLRSVAALYAADTMVTRDEFRAFVERLRLGEKYPGVHGLGFTRRLRPDLVPAFEALARSEGIVDFKVHPSGSRSEVHSIQYLEPQNRRNRVALGFDMFTDPVRRAAMERARDRGEVAVSGKVRLVQEIDPVKQPGFFIYIPVFAGQGKRPASVAERREKLVGFTYAPFRADDLFTSILAAEAVRGVRVEIFAGEPAVERRIHTFGQIATAPRFVVTRALRISDTPWTMVVSSNDEFERVSERRWIPWILFAGVLLALTLFLLTRSVVRNRIAIQSALDDLRDREERFRLVARATNDAIWDWDLGRDTIWWNEGVETLFGYPRSQVEERASWWYDRVHPEDRERVFGEIHQIVEGKGDVWRGEYRFRRHDGTFASVLDRGSVVRNQRGTGLRMIGAMFDVSPLAAVERKLAASERRFRTLVTTTSTIVWRTDPEGEAREPMVSWEQFTGQSFDQYRDRRWTEAIHPEDRELAAVAWREAVMEQRPFQTVYRLRHRSGEYRWVQVNGAPIRDDHGEIIEWTGTATDIHAQRETDRELAYSSQLIRTMAESVTTCLFLIDEHGYLTYLNDSARQTTGYTTVDETRGRRLHDAVHYRKPDGNPHPIEQCPIDNASNALQTLRNQEEVFVRKDGSFFPVIYSVTPLVRDGKAMGAVVEVRDVTEEKRAEAAIAEAAERFRFLAESMPQKMFTARPTGEVDYVNQQWAEYAGLNADQLRESGWAVLVHPEDLDGSLRGWRHAVETGKPLQMEQRFRRADGVYHWHLSRSHAMRDESGRILMWIGTNTDIEDQKQTEKTLEHLYHEADSANRAKDEFLATVSHELRTPMTAILGWSHLLSIGNIDPETAAEAVETIHRSAKAQAQLIEDMLDVSRIATGKLQLHLESITAGPIVRNAIRAITPAAEAKAITLITEIEEPGRRVLADATRMQQIFWNLLTNAVKFTPEGGKVRVRLRAREGEVVFEVSDTGKGITGDFLPHVFDRFRQEETTSTRHYSGLGIGLSIVKQLVEMHGGRVSAESEGEGQGATFRVSLPARPVDLDATGRFSRDRGDGAGERALEGILVLLVEDDADARRVVATILEQSGAVVLSAGSVNEALESWTEEVAVLVTDIAMPQQDGFDLLRHLEGRTGRPAVRAIALTAYGRPEDAERIAAAGFMRHLVKPVEPSELVTAVAEVARRS